MMAAGLFQTFSAIWPQKWPAQFVNDDAMRATREQWAIAIANLTDDDLLRGIDACRTAGDWPGSIAEFLTLAVKPKQIASHQRNDDALALPKETWAERQERAALAIQEMRKGLLKSTHTTEDKLDGK